MNRLKTRTALTRQLPGPRDRVRDPGVRDPSAAQMIARIAAGLVLGAAGIIGLYLIKTAMGINLLEGPSFMHEYFYHLLW